MGTPKEGAIATFHAQLPLRPSDRFYRSVPFIAPDGSWSWRPDEDPDPPTLGRAAAKSAGLEDAFFAGRLSLDVGGYVLHVPSGFRVVEEDEAEQLSSAREAALREMRREIRSESGTQSPQDAQDSASDKEAGATFVLLRGQAPARVKPYSIFDLRLRTWETIHVDVEDPVDMPRRMWAAVEVYAFPTPHNIPHVPGLYRYRIVHAVPDTGPLRLSDIHTSLSKALCFDAVAQYFLSRLDLSGEAALPDPAAAMQFLRQAHRQGLPPDTVPSEWTDGGRTRRPFAERLLAAMHAHPFSRQTGGELPARRLIKTFTEAERYAAEYMRYLGFTDAAATPPGSDGGIDVDATEAIAQVKMEGVATGRPVIQALYGIAALEAKRAVVFSLAGYTAQALDWADRAGVACFEFVLDGSVEPKSQAAHALEAPSDSS